MDEETGLRELAREAARRGEEFIAAVRANHEMAIRTMIAPGSAAAYLLDMFGPGLFRLDLRLDDEREAGRLAPYDIQLEGEVALLELGVLEPLEVEGAEGEQHGHLRRLFGSSLLLSYVKQGWLVSEVLPFNSDGALNPQNPPDKQLLDLHQGKTPLPLQPDHLDDAEWQFLTSMQGQAGRFNLEEMVNALRLWRDFKAKNDTHPDGKADAWAAGIEYLITLFDYHEAAMEGLAERYGVEAETVLDRAREIAHTLNVTQFDDRYSIHPDPVTHYRAIFGELGIQPEKDERIRLARERERVFDTIEPVPDDDEDFFGPR